MLCLCGKGEEIENGKWKMENEWPLPLFLLESLEKNARKPHFIFHFPLSILPFSPGSSTSSIYSASRLSRARAAFISAYSALTSCMALWPRSFSAMATTGA